MLLLFIVSAVGQIAVAAAVVSVVLVDADDGKTEGVCHQKGNK